MKRSLPRAVRVTHNDVFHGGLQDLPNGDVGGEVISRELVGRARTVAVAAWSSRIPRTADGSVPAYTVDIGTAAETGRTTLCVRRRDADA